MKPGYRELVGLQVTFSKVTAHYNLAHYYRFKQDGELGPVLSMKSYDLELTQSKESIVQGLRNAYAPAILSIWQLDVSALTAEYLQFQVGGAPEDLYFEDGWTHYAQW